MDKKVLVDLNDVLQLVLAHENEYRTLAGPKPSNRDPAIHKANACSTLRYYLTRTFDPDFLQVDKEPIE